MNSKFKTIDLFAGIGGIRLGFEEAGFETVYANDFDKYCKLTYDLNFKSSKLDCDDLWNVLDKPLPKFDFLLGGFPCQPFSVAGYRHGFNDAKGRGNLFFAIARLIEKYQPTGFLLENVKNLYNHDGGKTFARIKSIIMDDLGYFMEERVLNTMEFGNLPQTRERLYMVGFKSKRHMDKFFFPGPIPLTKQVGDMLDDEVDEKYYYDSKPLYEKLKGHIVNGGIYQWRRKYVRENKRGVIPTLTANMGTGGHNIPIIRDEKGIRKLTPRECARAQGYKNSFKFPDNIAISQIYKQIGNSVSIPVIKRVADRIKLAVSQTEEKSVLPADSSKYVYKQTGF